MVERGSIHLPVFLHLSPIVWAKIGDRCEQMPRKNSYATYQNCCTRLLRISSPQCTSSPHGSLSPSLERFLDLGRSEHQLLTSLID